MTGAPRSTATSGSSQPGPAASAHDARRLRAVVTGLIGFAAAQEQTLLADCDPAERGTQTCWAARPLVAHNTEFRQQQVRRLEAILRGETPPEFGEIDHASAEVYHRYEGDPSASVAATSWQVSGALMAGLRAVSDDDLLDPGRNPWLRGRLLWLQIIVRGFWHPSGHLGGYYLTHDQPDRAVDLATRAVQTAASLDAPDPARGMASYNLACALAGSGRIAAATAALAEAVARNPDVRANASRDPDLAALREAGLLADTLLP